MTCMGVSISSKILTAINLNIKQLNTQFVLVSSDFCARAHINISHIFGGVNFLSSLDAS